MQYPIMLTPTATEKIVLPAGLIVHIPKTRPVFDGWTGDPVGDTYGNKPVLRCHGEPVFAELAILRILQADGWDGVWVDHRARKYRTAFWPRDEVQLPPEKRHLVRTIYHTAGSTLGCWDVFCWNAEACLFAKSKREGRSRIRDTQRKWLEAALICGLPLESFLVVEWSLAEDQTMDQKEETL